MRYGIMLPSRGPLARPDSLSSIAQRAEDLGYHVMMFPDHIVLPRQTDSQYPYSESGVFPGTDNNETMAKFKKSLKAEFPFVADPDGKLVKLYDVKVPIFTVAKRWTFVIDSNLIITKIDTGAAAIDAAAAIGGACELPLPK